MDGAINIAPNGGEDTGKIPTDRAKSGSKRSLLADYVGVPIGLAIDGANKNDRALRDCDKIRFVSVDMSGRIRAWIAEVSLEKLFWHKPLVSDTLESS